jgi:hypothetical protein
VEEGQYAEYIEESDSVEETRKENPRKEYREEDQEELMIKSAMKEKEPVKSEEEI